MENLIVNIMGYSGAGKDTLATMLTLLDDRYHIVKFADSIKREVEQRFGLPLKFLEHRRVKGHQFSHGVEVVTYGSLLGELFHATKDCNSEYKLGNTPRIISMCHVYGMVPVITDCRNYCEARLLGQYGNVVHIWVKGGEALSTDELQDSIYNNFPATHRFHSINNVNRHNHISMARLLAEASSLHNDYLSK